MIQEYLKLSLDYFFLFFEKTTYLGVFLLMTIESSFIPFPSEIVVPPAGYLASKGKMNLFGVILAGTLGSLAGALINYYLALKLGRPMVIKFLRRYGKYILLTEASLYRVEKFWGEHGSFGTFIGRLLPGIRQVISIPAGFARMGLAIFCIYTSLGAGIWCTFLALCGYFFGKNEELLKKSLSEGSYALIGFVLIMSVIYIYYKYRKSQKSKT